MRLRVALDMDGVLTDFVGAACKLHNRTDPYLNGNKGNFQMDKIWNMKPQEFWSEMGYEYWRYMGWTFDGKTILSFLEEIVDDICILTSPCATPGCRDGKADWIKDNLPQYSKKVMMGSFKEFFASRHILLIDDYDKNIDNWAEKGGSTFLIPRPWNSRHNEVDTPWMLALEKQIMLMQKNLNVEES